MPQDRYRSLLCGAPLPEITQGSGLFADISGFTALTEVLTQKYGPRRGIEELARQINAVYQPLIGEIEAFGGSVIDFAGDSVICWFDAGDGESTSRAVTCAWEMQRVMDSFDNLALKIAITSGPARRLIAGDPDIQLLDTLAGATIARLAIGEHMATQGEVLLDESTVQISGATVSLGKWRTAETGERFALLTGLVHAQPPCPIADPTHEIMRETLKPWVPPVVYQREQSGLDEFLTELRPAVALFLRFSGIDYDGDEESGQKLDAFIRHVQRIVRSFDGNLLQLTVGDKGSYIYISYGVPITHEDDAQRAVQAAWELNQLPQTFDFLDEVQIGISKGTMRAGAYGGSTRHTYGALGDDTNLAARLMTTAAQGEILVSSQVHKLVRQNFVCEPRPPLPLKGKAEPLPVFAVTGHRRQRAVRLEEPVYNLPMVGRQDEKAIIQEKLDLTLNGQGQVIGITAEAGMGKSRLVAEVIRLAYQRGFTGYAGTCQSHGTNTAYLCWRSVWQAFFDTDPAAPLRRQLRYLEGEIEDRAPDRVQAMPVLSRLLDIPIEENEFTENLEPKDRWNLLTALLEDCLKSAAQEEPILLVLEDVHWIDPLSQMLLENLARVCAALPVCILLAYRPPAAQGFQKETLESLANFTRIELTPLQDQDAKLLIRAKLAQLYPERTATLPESLVSTITTRSDGNPFYVEELLNYLRDRGLNPYNLANLALVDLPPSLHALILSRIDQLSESQKVTLKVASIIGRLFRVSWLEGFYPPIGLQERVEANLAELSRLELTLLDTPEPELAYFFKHILTQEVAYRSQPYTTRSQLHEKLAQFLEHQEEIKFLDLIAFHYGLSENKAKQREYFQKAGDAAKAVYANDAALAYYERLEPLLENAEARIKLLLERGEIYSLIGKWQEAETDYRSAFRLSQQIDSSHSTVLSQIALGTLLRMRGEYVEALERLQAASTFAAQSNDGITQAKAQLDIGKVFEQTGKTHQAIDQFNTSLLLARQHRDPKTEALTQLALGSVYSGMGNYTAAQSAAEAGLRIFNDIGDKEGIAMAVNLLGLLAYYQGDLNAANRHFEECRSVCREIGDKGGMATAINNLALIANSENDFDRAQNLYEESLVLCREMGTMRYIALALLNLGVLAANQSKFSRAKELYEESLALLQDLGDRQNYATTLLNLGYLACEQVEYSRALETIQEALEIFQEVDTQWGIVYSLVGLAAIAAGRGEVCKAAKIASLAEHLRAAVNLTLETDGARLYRLAIDTAQDKLNTEDFNACWEDGKKHTIEDALRLMESE
jgi:predicted ATPase/class 3 adenylate cyclase